MNTSETVGNLFSEKTNVERPAPSPILPFLLILGTIGLNFLNFSSISPFFPLLAGSALFLIWNYKKIGLSIAFLAQILLFIFSPTESFSTGKMWHFGVHFSLCFSLIITYLTRVEVDESIKAHLAEKEQNALLLKSLKEEFEVRNQEWLREKGELEEEIKKWKEEAEQRRIDKVNDEKKSELLQYDLQLYLAQKEEIILDAQNARKTLYEKEKNLEIAFQNVSIKEHLLIDREKDLQTEKKNYEESLKKQEKELNRLEAEKNETLKKMEELTLELQKAKELLENQNAAIVFQVKALEEEKSKILEESRKLQELPVQPEIVNQLKFTESCLQQLKEQFAEKSNTLSETRKEYFKLQTAMMAKEFENQEEALSKPTFEVTHLQKEIDQLVQENQDLENEIIFLEDLISRLHLS